MKAKVKILTKAKLRKCESKKHYKNQSKVKQSKSNPESSLLCKS